MLQELDWGGLEIAQVNGGAMNGGAPNPPVGRPAGVAGRRELPKFTGADAP